jgi:hypothetical protein
MRAKHIRSFVAAMIAGTFLAALPAGAQQTAQIRSILGNFKSYRYSNVFLFKLDDAAVTAINPLLGTPEPKMNAAANRSKKKDAIQQAVDDGETDIAKAVKDNGGGVMNNDDREYEKYYRLYKKWQEELFSRAYIVTTRFRSGDPFEIIGLLTSANKELVAKLDECVDPPKGIFLSNELERIGSPDTNGVAKTLYQYLERKIVQNDAENVTAEAQGIGADATFLPQKYGATLPINEDDIQQYLRISDGQPQEYTSENELTIGAFDLIRFRHYGKLADLDENGNPVTETSPEDSSARKVYNKYLPLWGLEMRYGMPEINYPSLWSERMTMNVMWQSYKFGIILPTNGWSNLAKDVFNVQRRLTNAGFGVYGSLDFPIKLINQGGVFNFNASYVFGDAATNAVPTTFQFDGKTADRLRDTTQFRTLGYSYLPRFHAQAHYSFAIDIDRSHFFRFKLGASMYVIQRWAELTKVVGFEPRTNKPILETKNRLLEQYTYDDLNRYNGFDQLAIAALTNSKSNETVASLSGRIEFMTRSRTVPWGAALQYFDGAVSGDLWAQVSILDGFALRGEAQFFQTAFRDPKAWEEQTVVMPSLQMIFNF